MIKVLIRMSVTLALVSSAWSASPADSFPPQMTQAGKVDPALVPAHSTQRPTSATAPNLPAIQSLPTAERTRAPLDLISAPRACADLKGDLSRACLRMHVTPPGVAGCANLDAAGKERCEQRVQAVTNCRPMPDDKAYRECMFANIMR